MAAGEPVTPPHPEPDAGAEVVADRGEAQHPCRPLVARLAGVRLSFAAGRQDVVVERRVSRPVLVGVAGLATAAFGLFGAVTEAAQTATYVVTVVVLATLLARLDRTVRFSDLVAVGVTAWAVAHLAGGLVELDGDRVLYNAVLAPHLRYDNVVHFFGFGVAGVAAWEALAPRLAGGGVDPVAAGITVWLFGMGIGALNEVVEFAIALNVEESNIGGYLNTGRDLVANMLGAAVAALVVVRRTPRRPDQERDRAVR
jgi:hypothetical protein